MTCRPLVGLLAYGREAAAGVVHGPDGIHATYPHTITYKLMDWFTNNGRPEESMQLLSSPLAEHRGSSAVSSSFTNLIGRHSQPSTRWPTVP